MSLQQDVKKAIREYLADGEIKTSTSIKQYIEESGIVIKEKSSAIRTALNNLKRTGTIINVKRGMYQMSKDERTGNQNIGDSELSYVTVEACPRKPVSLQIKVTDDAKVSLNSSLLIHFQDGQASVELRTDGQSIVLYPQGEECIHITKKKSGKTGYFRNYNLLEKLKEVNICFPAVYIGVWNEEKNCWQGEYVKKSVNTKHIKKEKPKM